MNNVELRWVKERISPSHSSMTLQYRIYKDHDGPYPNYAWSEWMTVPTVDEMELAGDMMAGDGGYSIGTKEKYDEFVAKRNYPNIKVVVE